jgi:structural maintenance of chromosome 2
MANGESRVLLVCIDESSGSGHVFDWGLKNFYRAGDTLHLLHVIAPARRLVVTPDMGLEGVLEDDEETRRKVEEHAQNFIKERFETKLAELKIPYQVEIVRGCVDNDSIGALLCRRAEQLNAGVVLMGKHNRGAVKEFFIGSVSNYALHHCKQPVLVLHCD